MFTILGSISGLWLLLPGFFFLGKGTVTDEKKVYGGIEGNRGRGLLPRRKGGNERTILF